MKQSSHNHESSVLKAYASRQEQQLLVAYKKKQPTACCQQITSHAEVGQPRGISRRTSDG
eukprot:5712758-Prorocentrum_lima.AAC.1